MVTKENFYEDTIATFICVGAVDDVGYPYEGIVDMWGVSGVELSQKPDFISKKENGGISSLYWYTDDGVYRASDHWGEVKNSQWDLEIGAWGEYDACHCPEFLIGYCKWEEFQKRKEEALCQ